MPFLTEPEPPHDAATAVRPGIRRLVADNPGPMTYRGTNTYLIDAPDGAIVLDPGPDDAAHVSRILAACDGRVGLILLSHTHRDHVGALPALRAASGAAVAAWHKPSIDGFAPDIALDDGGSVAGFAVVHTPGHAADHVCFARTEADGTRVLFSADHVMSWSSSIVSPPDGDMAAYFASLRLLLARDDAVYLPGHGPPLEAPHALVEELLSHRTARETAILEELRANGPKGTRALTDALYSQTLPLLRLAAERNVLAHLLKLEGEGLAARDGDVWRAA